MNKKILAKTLLPISTIVLLGGGIASSLVLTSCGNSITFKSVSDVDKYISKHAVKLSTIGDTFYYNNSSGELENSDSFYRFVYDKYNKQAYINGVLALYAGGSGVFDDGGKIILKNNNSISLPPLKNNNSISLSAKDGEMSTIYIDKFNHLDDYLISYIMPGQKPFSESWNPSLQILSYSARYDTEFNQLCYISLEFSDSNNIVSIEIPFSSKDLDKSHIVFSPQESSL
jgi:hypothetical protein